MNCLQVVDKDLQNSMGIEEIPLHVQYVVLSEWFTSSLHQQRRAYEWYYSLFRVSLNKSYTQIFICLKTIAKCKIYFCILDSHWVHLKISVIRK